MRLRLTPAQKKVLMQFVMRTNNARLLRRAQALLDQLTEPLASFTGDGAYDQDKVYGAIAARHPEAAVIVPPRATAVPSAAAETAPTPRDLHLQTIGKHGRMSWQKSSGYNLRARVEALIGRYKRVIGDTLQARSDENEASPSPRPP